MQNDASAQINNGSGKNPRYYFVDGLRGLAIVNMVLYHFLYDVFVVYGYNPYWPFSTRAHIWQQAICWSFIFISGFVWHWGRKSNLKRGLMLNGWGLVITAVTLIVMPSETIWFGILNFIGCAVLLMILLDRVMVKVPAVLGMVVSFAAFLISKPVQLGYVGLGNITIHLPRMLYDIKLLTPLGFPFDGFWSSDYFPILPWMFLFLCGYFFQKIFQQQEQWKQLATIRIPVLSFIGKKTLWIYLLHQPVIMLVCMLFFQ